MVDRTIWDAWITAVEADLGRDLDDVERDLANEACEDDLTPAEFADAVLIAAQEREDAV